MSQNNDIRFCSKCGAKNDKMAKFCFECGAQFSGGETQDAAVDSVNASLENEADESMSHELQSDGADLYDPAAEEPTEEKPKKVVRKIGDGANRVRAFISMIALIAFVFLFFAPVATVRKVDVNRDGYADSIDYSPFDAIDTLEGVFSNIDKRGESNKVDYQYDSNGYANTGNGDFAYSTEGSVINMNSGAGFNRGTLPGDGTAMPNLSFWFAAVVVCIFAVTIVVGLIASAVALVDGKYDDEKARKRLRISRSVIMFLLSIVPIVILSLMHTCHSNYMGTKAGIYNVGVKMAYGGVIMLLICILAFLQITITYISRIVGTKKVKERYTVITRATAFVAVIIAAFAIFLPCISARFAISKSKGADVKTYGISAAEIHELTDSEWDFYYVQGDLISDEQFIHMVSGISSKNKRNSYLADTLLHITMFISRDSKNMYTLMSMVQFVLMIMISVLIRGMFKSIFERKTFEHQGVFLVLTTLLSVIYLILTIVISAVSYSGMSYQMALRASFSIGASPIVMSVCMIITIIALNIREPEVKSIEYDNPDVSVAPYVI